MLGVKISLVMDKFEGQFEDMDVQTEYMESAMAGTTSLVTPQNEIDDLMAQVADEHGLELSEKLGEAQVGTSLAAKENATDNALNERLAKLRNG
jgi:charged multivesicular body protein 1